MGPAWPETQPFAFSEVAPLSLGSPPFPSMHYPFDTLDSTRLHPSHVISLVIVKDRIGS